MEIKELVPFITLFAGWLLAEASRLFQVNRQGKEAISALLADLLDVRYGVLSVNFFIEEFCRNIPIKPEEKSALRAIINAVTPDQSALHDRFNQSVSEVAKRDPILAFKLRGKTDFSRYFSGLTAIAGKDIEAVSKIDEIQGALLPLVEPEFDKVIRKLAWELGIVKYWEIRLHLAQKFTLPIEMRNLMDSLKDEYKAETENEKIGEALPEGS